VVGVEDEEHLEGALEGGVHDVLRLRHLEHHLEEVARVGEVVVGVGVGHPHGVAVGEGGERRDLGDEPDDLLATGRGVVDVLRLGVERRQPAHRGDEHPHGMGVVAEAGHEVLDVLVHHRVVRDVVRPLPLLLARRQLAMD
jgi:hypothetical protein